MPNQSRVKISQIRTLSVERLGERMGRLSPELLAQLAERAAQEKVSLNEWVVRALEESVR